LAFCVIDLWGVGEYNFLDNRIAVSWLPGDKTLAAEQDNRVQIPNGTAAVSVMGRLFDESQSLGDREGKALRKGRNLLCKNASQKTYESDSPSFCAVRKERLSRKTGRGAVFAPWTFCFWRYFK
jgi:hypothetical protein